jgi:acyl-CoA dehydrogenase
MNWLRQLPLPEDAVIGEIGRGFHYALEGLNEGRMNVGATAVGMGEYALELAIEESKVRPAFGGVISDFQAIRHYIATMATDMRAARLILLDAAWRYDQGEKKRELASMAKLFATEAGSRTVDTALQIFGGSGYCKGFAIERLYRDIRITRIYEGLPRSSATPSRANCCAEGDGRGVHAPALSFQARSPEACSAANASLDRPSS